MKSDKFLCWVDKKPCGCVYSHEIERATRRGTVTWVQCEKHSTAAMLKRGGRRKS